MINRLCQFIESQGISINAFERKISASNGMIRKAISNNTDIQSKWLLKIIENFPQLNIEWLFTGNGPMLKDLGKKNINQSITGNNNIQAGTNSKVNARQSYNESPDGLRAQLEEKERILQEKEERIREKDAQIQEKDAQIKQKDAQINQLLTILSNK